MYPLTSYLGSSKEILFRMLNDRHGSYLNPNAIDASYPIACGPTTTKVHLSPYREDHTRGTVTVEYDRWDLGQFFYGVTVTTSLKTPSTVERVCQEILDKHHVEIDPNDVELSPLPEREHLIPYRFTLKAKPTSLLWVGEMHIWGMADSHLSKAFQYQLIAPNGFLQKRNAYLYAVEHDLTGLDDHVVDSLLEEEVISTLNPTTHHLLAFLKERTGESWTVTRQRKNRNLFGGRVKIEDGVLAIVLGPLCHDLYGPLIFEPPKPDTDYPVIDLDGFQIDTPLDQLLT